MTETTGAEKVPWEDHEYEMEDVLKWRDEHPFPEWVTARSIERIIMELDEDEAPNSIAMQESVGSISHHVLTQAAENPCCEDRSPSHVVHSAVETALSLGIRIGLRGGNLMTGLDQTPVESEPTNVLIEKYENEAFLYAKWVAYRKENRPEIPESIRDMVANLGDGRQVIVARTPEELKRAFDSLGIEPPTASPATEGSGEESQTGMYL